MGSTTAMSQHKHAPRECRVVKSEEYVGYGFNLYQEKNKPGQYIGRIEPGSPADKAGLKENDRLVEVNNVNIAEDKRRREDGSLGRQDSGVSEGDAETIVTSEAKRESEDIAELGLNLSVQEVKERIRRRRKHDPRTIPIKRTSGD